MDEVTIKDKRFELYISPAQIQTRIQELSESLNEVYANKNPILIIVLNGAFIFAADLIRAMTVMPQTQFIRVSSYEDSMHSSQKVKQILGLNMSLTGRHALIIEDIVDTGATLEKLYSMFDVYSVKSLSIATLLFKLDSRHLHSFSSNLSIGSPGFPHPFPRSLGGPGQQSSSS